MNHSILLPLAPTPWRATVAAWSPALRRAWHDLVPLLQRGGLRQDQAERLGAVEVALRQPDPERLLFGPHVARRQGRGPRRRPPHG